MQPSPIAIVFVSKNTTLSLRVLAMPCSVLLFFFFIMYVEQALDLRILVTRTLTKNIYKHNDSYSLWQHLARTRSANHGHFEKNILCICCT